MLQKNTIETKTFELLTELMNEPILSDFFLVGGTSIALQIGHRKSIDLDLFSQNDINVAQLNDFLSKKYHFIERYRAKHTLKGEINGVFIDCMKYDYKLVKAINVYNNIRIASLEDVIAMKLSAITDNGSRLKDFVDIAYLSVKYSLQEMLSFYAQKYNDSNMLSAVKALGYFEDIDFESEPVELVNKKFSWKKIKDRINDMIKEPYKVFDYFQ